MFKVIIGDFIKILRDYPHRSGARAGEVLQVTSLMFSEEIEGAFEATDSLDESWVFDNEDFYNNSISLLDSISLEERGRRIEQIEQENKELKKLNDISEMRKQMKPVINFHVLNDSIVLNYSGKTQNIASDDSRYEKVLGAIRTGQLELIPEIVEVERAFQGTGLELRDGLLYEGEVPFPSELSARILKFKDAGLPYAPLIKFWDNLKKNPSYNARTMMFKFLEHNGIPLTQDGCFIAYRGVTEDFKDKHTKTFDNSPGSICEMARELVDDNPNNTCSAGLHVACYQYAKDFGTKLVEVKVNPIDVVAVPTDYNGTKMRTCKFEVVCECVVELDKLVYDEPEEESELEDHCVSVKDITPNYRHAKRDKQGKFVAKKKGA